MRGIVIKRNGVVVINLNVRNRVGERNQVVIAGVSRIIEIGRRAGNVAVGVVLIFGDDNLLAVVGVALAVVENNFFVACVVVKADDTRNNAVSNRYIDAVANTNFDSLAGGIFGAFLSSGSHLNFNRNRTSRQRRSVGNFVTFVFAVFCNGLNRQSLAAAFRVGNRVEHNAVNRSTVVSRNFSFKRNSGNDNSIAVTKAGRVNRNAFPNRSAAVRIDFKGIFAVIVYIQSREVRIAGIIVRRAVVDAVVVSANRQICIEINRAVRNRNVLDSASQLDKVNTIVNVVNFVALDNLVAFADVSIAVPSNSFAIVNSGDMRNHAVFNSDSYNAVRIFSGGCFAERYGNSLAVRIFVAGRNQSFVVNAESYRAVFQRNFKLASLFAGFFIRNRRNINRQAVAIRRFNEALVVDNCSNALSFNVNREVNRDIDRIGNIFACSVNHEIFNICNGIGSVLSECVSCNSLIVSLRGKFSEVARRRKGFRGAVVRRVNRRIERNGSDIFFVRRNLNVRDSRNVGEHANQINILVRTFNSVDIVAVVDNIFIVALVFNAVKFNNFAAHEVSSNAREFAANNCSSDAVANFDSQSLTGNVIFAFFANERRSQRNIAGNVNNAVRQGSRRFNIRIHINRQAVVASRRERNSVDSRAASRGDFSCETCGSNGRIFNVRSRNIELAVNVDSAAGRVDHFKRVSLNR